MSISGWASSAGRDRRGKSVAIDREGAAGGYLIVVRRSHDQRAEPAHLFMQKTDRVVLAIVGAERIGADQLGLAIGLVRRRCPARPHFMQHHRHAGLRELPGRLGPCESAAHDMH